MTESIALAIAVPAALGAAWLASRRSWSPAAADNRGIALQTVIVIVVMLVIAGAVAGVLLSRGSQVTSQLEAQEVSNVAEFDSESSCDGLFQGDAARSTYTAASGAQRSTCVYQGNAAHPTSAGECVGLGGSYDSAANNGHGSCTLTR